MEVSRSSSKGTTTGDSRTKREKVLASCRHYKDMLKKWEIAVQKTEGRKPGKVDLKSAPEQIQKAYKQYYRLSRYLESTPAQSSSPGSKSRHKGISPQKIFGLERTSSRTQGNTLANSFNYRDPEARGRSSKNVDKHTTYSRFALKISSACSLLAKTNSPDKLHQIVKVVDETSGEEVERKALVANRFLKKSLDQEKPVDQTDFAKNCDIKNVADSSDSSGNSSMFGDESESTERQDIPVKTAEETEGFDSPKKPNKLISTIWQNLSPSPKTSANRRKMNSKPVKMKHVDVDWLERCGSEKLDSAESPTKTADVAEASNLDPKAVEEDIADLGFSIKLDEFDFDDEDDAIPDPTPVEKASRLFAPEFESFLISAEPKGSSLPTFKSVLIPSDLDSPSASGDSGIGIYAANVKDVGSSCFTSEQQHSDTTDNTEPMEVAFHSENACFPPSSTLQTIDLNAVSDLFSTDSFPIMKSVNVTPSKNSRKRSVSMAFSPSPKKPTPKKRFFKTDRSLVRKYSMKSYKPPTPVKKKLSASAVPTVKSNVSSTVTASSPSSDTAVGIPPDKSSQSIKENQLPSSSTDSVAVKPKRKKSTSTANSSKTKTKKVTKEPQTNDAPSKPKRSKYDDVNYFNDDAEHINMPRKKWQRGRRPRLTGKAALESKINSGGVNENFVRIDITKKVFVRGHKKISGAKCKRNDWKLKKAAASKDEQMSKMKCRKCGEAGHFARFCTKDATPQDEPDEIDDSPFPTLEEVANMRKVQSGNTVRVNVYAPTETSVASSSTDVEVTTTQDAEAATGGNTLEPLQEDSLTPHQNPLGFKAVPPYFGYEEGSVTCTQDEEEEMLQKALVTFGYSEFRSGQKEAISRVLKGLSTLVILSTGSGKSLCYQLPAYLYAQKNPGAMAICISPLVSLMEDQVQGIPSFLQAACIHSNMPSGQKEKVLERIRQKKLHILLVSPEAVCGGLFGLLRGGNELPQISFACIDEVHCLSQWSHNFRPCYLQLAKILREKLNVTTILGLTATATASTAMSVCRHLRVDPSTTIRGEIFPTNLDLSVSRDSYRDEGLLNLLRGERFKECESIIIYCTRREECMRLSVLIRTSLQESREISKINCRQRVSTACEAYHAGMTPGRRRLVQQQFMSGKIRIVVATVAFGMGIDKSNIRSVIHYNMPKTFESYVQEIGRAGRDGLPAHCHLFMENVKGRDLSELRRHVYANSVDRPTLRKLLRKVFQTCKCARLAELSGQSGSSEKTVLKTKKRCPGHEVSFSIAETVEALDLPQENITTLLCYLELDEGRKWVQILPHTYQTCKIHSYGGAKLLKASALKCPPLAAAIALAKEKKKFKETDTYFEFNVIEVASTLGWNSGIAKRELKNLEWAGTNFDNEGNSTKFRKSGILVEFCDLAFHLNAPGDLSDEEADIILDYLHKHNTDHENAQLYQLHRVYQALLSVSCPNVDSVANGHDETKSGMLKNFICDYFIQSSVNVPTDWKPENAQEEDAEEQIRRDVRDLLASSKDVHFTGRAAAKILQGIPSPCFPAETWARNRAFWRKHLDLDFNYLCKIAGQEILRYQ